MSRFDETRTGFAWGTEEVVTCMVDVATYGTVRSTEQTTVALP